MTAEKKRIFIGGLFPSVNEADLRERFSHFGIVSHIEIKTKKGDDDTPKKTFAYLDITATEKDINKCFSIFNKTKWKGQELKVAEAKESFLTRLEAERQELKKPASQDSQNSSSNNSDSHIIRPLENIPGVKDYVMKGAKPGTPIPGEQNWIVGKYGRVLPVVYVRKKNGKKIMRVDPSKFTHNLKMIKPEQNEDELAIISPNSLTWKLDDTEDTETTRKRKGIFPEWKSKKQKILNNLDTGSHQDRKDDEYEFEIVMPKEKYFKHNSSSAKDGFNMKELLDKSTEDVDQDSCSSADTDELIFTSRKSKGDINKSSTDFGTSFTTSTPNCFMNGMGMKSNLKPNCLSKELKSIVKQNESVALNSHVQSKNNKKSENLMSYSNKLKNCENKVVSSLSSTTKSSTKVKDFQTNKSSTNMPYHESKRKMPIMQEFKGTKCLYDKDMSLSVLSAKVEEKEDMPICRVSELKSSKLIPEFQISVPSSAFSRKDISDSDHCSVKSDNTDEIINLSKNYRQVYLPPIDTGIPSSQKNKQSLNLTNKSFIDEVSNGFVDRDLKHYVSNDDHDDEESDFEAFAKKELQKLEKNRTGETLVYNNKHSVDNEIVKSRNKGIRASFPLVTKSDKDAKALQSLKSGRNSLIINNTLESTKMMPPERKKTEAKRDTGVEKNKIMEVDRKHKIAEKQKDKERKKDNNNDDILKQKSSDKTQDEKMKDGNGNTNKISKEKRDDQKRLEAVKRKQMELETQNRLIKNALSVVDQSSGSNKKIVFSSDSEVENTDLDNVKKLCSEPSTLVSGKLQSLTSRSDDLSSQSDTDSSSDHSTSDAEEGNSASSETNSESSDSKIGQLDKNHTGHEKMECDDDSSSESGSLASTEEESENSDTTDSGLAGDVETVTKEMEISHTKQMGTKKVSLFDHSENAESDEDGVERDRDMFRLRPEFEGETGKKLMKLQSRYGDDPRFRLDKRFKESDSDSETPKGKDGEDETTKSLKILQDVLGDKANIKVTAEERNKNKFKDVTLLHFDPTRDDHKHYEIKKPEGTFMEMQSEKRKKMKKPPQQDEKEENRSLDPPVSKEKYYKVSSSLTESFSNKGSSTQSDNKGFSLLAMFGGKGDDDKEKQQDHLDAADQGDRDKALRIKAPYIWEHFGGGGDNDGVENNSDDDVDERSKKAMKKKHNTQGSKSITNAAATRFFFTEDDERLKEGTTFCRMDSLETIKQKWEEEKTRLMEIYKTRCKKQRKKSRNAMKPKRFG